MADFDLIIVADTRFAGGTSTAVATEIEAAANAGYRVGLLHVEGSVLQRPRPMNPRIRAALDRSSATWIDPEAAASCQLLIVHHPMIFGKALARPPPLRAGQAVLIAHHPRVNGDGLLQYDIAAQLNNVAESFGVRSHVAPVGPAVRATFDNASDVVLIAEDWCNLIDADRWPRNPRRRFRRPIVIGRHARPDLLKWPDERSEILAAYPADNAFEIRVLGYPESLRQRVGSIPDNWRLTPFGGEDVKAFLQRLDVYVYFHSKSWIEGFGYGVLEALAVGLPAIVPRSFEQLFGPAAIYGNVSDTRELVLALGENVPEQRRIAEAARAVVRERFDLDQYRRRLERLFDVRPMRDAVAIASERVPRTVMFVSSNGVGLGHLTRQMAVAKRLPSWTTSIFFSMSAAVRLARDGGYLVEHTSFHRYTGATPEHWNAVFAQELYEALLFYKPTMMIFDGNIPYAGMLAAAKVFPNMPAIWIRRAMWRDYHGVVLDRAVGFDAVIEPGELAADLDDGPTRAVRGETLQVGPVLLVRPEDRLAREQARDQLGLSARDLAIALQLGAGNNFDYRAAREVIIDELMADERVIVIELISPISERTHPAEMTSNRHRLARLYPSFLLSNAFDGAVSASGYNSFHEFILGAIPTLFIPNEAEEMDRQDARARFAEDGGFGWQARSTELGVVASKARILLDHDARYEASVNMSRLVVEDGATQIARFIEEVLLAAR